MKGCLQSWHSSRAALLCAALVIAMASVAQCPGIRPVFSWASNGAGVVFTDLTEHPGVNITERHWVIGGVDTAQLITTTHVFDSAGVDSVHLIMMAEGCYYSVSALVGHAGDTETCTSSISSTFSYVETGNNQLALTDQSTSDAPVLLYLWAFGDGNTSFDQHTEHFWPMPGAYDVSHSIAGLNDQLQTTCVAGRAEHVFVDGNASTCDTSLFLALDAEVNGPLVTLNAQQVLFNPDLTITGWQWDYGDGSPIDITSTSSAEHYYPYGGVVQICLRVTASDSLGNTCFARACTTVSMLEAVGLNGTAMPAELHAHPVPCDDDLWVEGEAVRAGRSWHIVDALGREAATGTFTLDDPERIDVHLLPVGLYTLTIRTEQGLRSIRVLKQ